MKQAVIAIVILAAIAASFFLGRKSVKMEVYERDTVLVYRPSKNEQPKPVSSNLVNFEPVKYLWIVTSDTTVVEVEKIDTQTVYIPIEEKYYEELDGRLRMWVSGYEAKLSKWELDEKEYNISDTQKKHWGFSVTFGPSVIYSPIHNNADIGIGITGGISYTF